MTISDLLQKIEYGLKHGYITPSHEIAIHDDNGNLYLLDNITLPSVKIDYKYNFKISGMLFYDNDDMFSLDNICNKE
jgi:hypothetical protein